MREEYGVSDMRYLSFVLLRSTRTISNQVDFSVYIITGNPLVTKEQ